MPRVRLLRLVLPLLLVVVLLVLPGSCATARNYTDPTGPSYVTHYGRGAAVSDGAVAQRDLVRVVTFNIKHAEKIDGAIEVLQRTAALRDPDVLLLQEMDAPGTERIARALQMNSVYIPSTVHPHNQRDFGNALLSPWPIENARKLILPHESRIIHLRRVVTVADVRIAARPVRVYSVHVETVLRLGGSARRDQVQVILDDAHSATGPVIIAGDLNSRGLAPLFAQAGYWWLTRDVHNTAAWFDFDHVFARGLHPAVQPAAGSEDNRGASDHRPVWAMLRFD